ncbi:MAG: hypothetical protein PHI79_00805 [Sulfurovaceae bacterium]|nr:hypothetical protein [Sulfurovaceae bacterium]MDD5548118.1 hypothetical protein [Sulfurovaceae bacterium]
MKIISTLFFIVFIFNGCATWDGAKQDSKAVYGAGKEAVVDVKDSAVGVYEDTKGAIHKATE